jgi:hypothetical protein
MERSIEEHKIAVNLTILCAVVSKSFRNLIIFLKCIIPHGIVLFQELVAFITSHKNKFYHLKNCYH